MGKKVKLGISRCLLGDKVRYDGSHKRDRYLVEVLGPHIDYVPVCPEVECGLPVPREPIRLVGTPDAPQLLGSRTDQDHTERMLQWTASRVDELEKETLCGFILKNKSPSCGMVHVRLYNHSGAWNKHGIGLFARALIQRFPLLPIEENERLGNKQIRENFIERIFVFHRWWDLMQKDRGKGCLVGFHKRHKLLFLSHSPSYTAKMGRLVADAKGMNTGALFSEYLILMSACLRLHATTRKHTNVLRHIMGYFKKHLSRDEKQELLEVIESYHREQLPLIVPVALLNHYAHMYNDHYLKLQHYLSLHPSELSLRNHA